jgi:hypothetical protein
MTEIIFKQTSPGRYQHKIDDFEISLMSDGVIELRTIREVQEPFCEFGPCPESRDPDACSFYDNVACGYFKTRDDGDIHQLFGGPLEDLIAEAKTMLGKDGMGRKQSWPAASKIFAQAEWILV